MKFQQGQPFSSLVCPALDLELGVGQIIDVGKHTFCVQSANSMYTISLTAEFYLSYAVNMKPANAHPFWKAGF